MTSNKRTIPLFSSALANQGIDLAGAMRRVLESNSFVMGKEVAAFEAEFAAYTGVAHCISVANGTDALELALRALDLQPGQQVACVANAGFYSATAIHLAGGVPLYVEVDEQSLTMAPQALERALRDKPAAVIATHLYGQLADIEQLAALCRSAGVPLIEDCAQSHGASRGGRRAGSFGDIACFSFYPTKNLGALGDGGAVLTANDALAARLRALRQYGWSKKYEVAMLGGGNSRLDELQAALLREKLPLLEQHNARRRAIAARYNQAFAKLPLRLPVSVGADFAAHLYVVRTERREGLRAHLAECGVATDVHYPIADIRQPAFGGRYDGVSLPVSEAACASAMSLPCFPGMPDEDVERVVEAVAAFFSGAGA
ncbi:DegT/DnrJ/EryC1/StrS family aminotransferase [Caenimonas terrae]|uniref:DegT/DnrJ/EryC1/StrS family aminotransferase n=1 Tax=Caenimonas terrae TaxID=696074 RepID=A0ABW0NMU7_9BURK